MQRKRSRKSGVEKTDVIKLRGCLQMQLHNALAGHPDYGKPIGEKVVIDNIPVFLNTVVTSGRRWVLSRIYTNDAQTISHCAVGTGTTAPTTANTALGSETTRLAIGTFTTTGLDSNPPSWRAETTFATNLANTTLGEAGLFNSSSSGTMLSRVTFSTIDKTTSNTLSVSYTISN